MPTFSTCDLTDSTAVPGIPRKKKYFASSDSIVFGGYYRHVRNTHTATVTIYRPDNQIWMTWQDDDQFSNNFHNSKVVLTPAKLPANAMEGRWRYTVVFEGIVHTVYFFVSDCVPSRVLFGDLLGISFHRASSFISSKQTLHGGGGTEAIYQAGQAVTLKPGFWARSNSKFLARVATCDDVPDD